MTDIIACVDPVLCSIPQLIDRAVVTPFTCDGFIGLPPVPANLEGRLFIWHPQAIPVVEDMEGLLCNLFTSGVLTRHNVFSIGCSVHITPTAILTLSCALQIDPELRDKMEKRYNIYWEGGVVLIVNPGSLQTSVLTPPLRCRMPSERVTRVDGTKLLSYEEGWEYVRS